MRPECASRIGRDDGGRHGAQRTIKSAAQLGAQLVKTASGKSFEGWFNLGVAYQKTNRLEQAGQAYAEALKLQTDSPLAYANLGRHPAGARRSAGSAQGL